MKLIDKDALVAEIKNLIERAEAERVLYPKTILAAKNYLLIEDYKKLLSFLDTPEVIEVGVDLGDPKGDKSAKYIIDTKTLEEKEMNLEEKATQLSQKYFPDEENIWARSNIEAQKCKSACIEMVEWLKAQKG